MEGEVVHGVLHGKVLVRGKANKLIFSGEYDDVGHVVGDDDSDVVVVDDDDDDGYYIICVIKIILHQAVTRTVTLKVQHGYSPQLTPKEPRRELFTFILKMVNS